MNQNLTEIAVIIDRSGSMESIATDAIGGFNAFLREQQQDTADARLTLILFDDEFLTIHDSVDVRSVAALNDKTYTPGGSTALFDAVGRTIDQLGQRLAATPEAERPAKVVVAILTDGHENASTDYTQSKIAGMIEHQRAKYGWEFIFLAANQDAVASAAAINIQAADAVSFVASSKGMRGVFAEMSSSVIERKARR